MADDISNVSLKFSCNEDWKSMAPNGDCRFCNSCNKIVYDFTDLKQQEFLSILAENNNNICGRFRAEQVIPQPAKHPFWRRWVSAAMLLIGINVLNNHADAQTSKPKISKQNLKQQPEMLVGFVMGDEVMPRFPGGEEAMNRFLIKNIRYNKVAKNGKVFATFTVKKNGAIADIKILRSPDPINSREVIRVLKLSPKWHPGKQNGKLADVQYTMPVNFSS